MIKKYFNLSLLSKVRHQSSIEQMQVRSLSTLTPDLNQSKKYSATKTVKHLAQCHASSITNTSMDKLNTTLSIGALVILQGIMMMPVHAASAVKSGQRVLMIEMTPALCSIQPTRARMRQCLEGYSLTVSGLDMGYGVTVKSR